MTPDRHMNELFASTYEKLTNIRKAFNCMDKRMLKKDHNQMIRPKLEYAAVVWSPHMLEDIKKLKRIQK